MLRYTYLAYSVIPYFLAHKTNFFYAEKCDLISTCLLCTESKYYFQTDKYPYIYYTLKQVVGQFVVRSIDLLFLLGIKTNCLKNGSSQ